MEQGRLDLGRAKEAIEADPDWQLKTINGIQLLERTKTSTGDHRISWNLVDQDTTQPKLEVRVELEGDDVVFTLGLYEGRVEFTGIRVDGMLSGVDQRLPINPRTFTRLGLQGISEQVHRELKTPWLKYLLKGVEDVQWAEAFALHRRPGRKGHNDYWYACLALDYVDAFARKPRAPIIELCKTIEPKQLAGIGGQKAIKNRLTEARKRGLLTASPKRGKAGGELTPKAVALLNMEVTE